MSNELTTKNTQSNIFQLSRGLKVSDYASLNSQKTKQHSDELKNLLKDSDELARSSTAR